MFKLKRAYEAAERTDGVRILVDRLWPRGVSKAKLRLAPKDGWQKEVAPSTALRMWFGHDPKRWGGFKKRYETELRGRKAELAALKSRARGHTVTLIYGAKDEAHNEAVVLKDVLTR